MVATVILAATFTAGVAPPGGVWQETNSTPPINHLAGQAVLASHGKIFTGFLCWNTAVFSSATIVIGFLVANFPFILEIRLALFCMSATYGLSIGSITSASTHEGFVYVSFFAPYILRLAVKYRNRRWLSVGSNNNLPSPPLLTSIYANWNLEPLAAVRVLIIQCVCLIYYEKAICYALSCW